MGDLKNIYVVVVATGGSKDVKLETVYRDLGAAKAAANRTPDSQGPEIWEYEVTHKHSSVKWTRRTVK